MRRVAALLLCLIIITGLAACGEPRGSGLPGTCRAQPDRFAGTGTHAGAHTGTGAQRRQAHTRR